MRKSVLSEYDRDAYEPVYDRDAQRRGRLDLIGVNRRPQSEIDYRKAMRAKGEPVIDRPVLDA